MKNVFPRALAVIVVSVALASCSRFAVKPPAELQLVSQCMIFDLRPALIRSLPGWLCHFYPDGSALVSTETELSFYDPELRRLWKSEPAHFHHMLHVSSAGRIYVLTSEWRRIDDPKFRLKYVYYPSQAKAFRSGQFRGDEKVRVDRIQEFASDGKKLGAFSIPDAYPLGVLSLNEKASWARQSGPEASHLNSIHEIPWNRSKNPAFRPGNLVLNDTLNRRVIVLDPDLREVLWRWSYPDPKVKIVHDMQVTEAGTLIYVAHMESEGASYNSLQEIDPDTNALVWHFEASPRERFNMEAMGSVQLLSDGSIFFADLTAGKVWGRRISRQGKPLASYDISSSFTGQAQGIYLEDMQDFLRNSRGP